MNKSKLLIINGSYRPNGYTHNVLFQESERLRKQYNINLVSSISISNSLYACLHCNKCQKYCNIDDSFKMYIKLVEESDRIIFGSPVYLDMPSAKMVAFLTRLNCMADNTGREFFRGKKAHFVAVGYCSGTKTVIRAMMGACEMLGFSFDGRCSKEYILKWDDYKIRGGMGNEKPIFVTKEK